MTVAEVLEKWIGRIERCKPGDGESVGRLLGPAFADLDAVPCSLWELLDAGAVLYSHAMLRAEPRFTLEDVAARWATLVRELPD